MITLTQLRVFAAVAQHGHVTRAAEELALAQPSVSYHLRELERQLEVRLLEHVGRRVLLTPAGERLAALAAALLGDLDELERDMRDYAAGERGRLRLGATRTVGSYALPSVLAEFCRNYPRVEVHLEVDNTEAVERLLLGRAIDLAVVEGRVHSPELATRALRRDALVLVAAPDHPLAGRDALSLEDLRGNSFILREPGSGTRALMEAALTPVLDHIVVTLELDQPEAIVRLVEAGAGLTCISETIVTQQLAAGTLRVLPLAGVELTRAFTLVSLRRRPFTPAMRAFAGLVTRRWAEWA